MKIKRYYMEDWLNDSMGIECNLSASGCQDFLLKDLLALCDTPIESFNDIFLGDNDTRGSLQLRNEILKSYQDVKLEEVMVTNGSSEALFAFFNELLDAGDEVVIPFPAFQCLDQIPISIGCRVEYLNLLQCKDWRLDIDTLDRMVGPATRLIIINNPHNPVGWTLCEEELLQIGEIAHKNDAYLIFDEHYRYLPLREGTDLIPSGYDVCKKIHPKTFASGSMIKCFGIVGIRIGWLIGEPGFLSRCRDYKDYLTHTIPEVTDTIAYLSLKNKEKIITDRKRFTLPNVEVLNRFMAENAHFFEYVAPTGGVVCFPRLRTIADSKEFCQVLMERYRVSILPGFSFQADQHLRINFGVDSAVFNRGLDAIRSYIESLPH